MAEESLVSRDSSRTFIMSQFSGNRSMPRWGFIGSGKMATALIKGMIRAGLAPSETINASDPLEAARTALQADSGVALFDSNLEVARRSNVLVLAVKPQSMREVLHELRPEVTADHLVVSVAAGITIASIDEGLGARGRIVRVMPNTPALVGEGASAYAMGSRTIKDDETVVRGCLESVGRAVRVPESLLDAVTGLSGSGPAFVYMMIEALSDGGVRVGLPRDVATLLAVQTVLGAAMMVRETGLHPGVLKDQVASPGGTTIAGLHELERGRLRGTLIDAVEAATRRSAELAVLARPASPPPSPSPPGHPGPPPPRPAGPPSSGPPGSPPPPPSPPSPGRSGPPRTAPSRPKSRRTEPSPPWIGEEDE
jgi:pyrroline-5-carboxylate reductase